MTKFTNPLNEIKIASPCSADWNRMIGDEQRRYCGDCKLNVYNLSAMSRAEAENFILESEGRVCVRFYRRADGTVLTKDCPVSWRKAKNRAARVATAFASFIFTIFGGLGLSAFFNQSKNWAEVGEVAAQNIETAPIAPEVGEAVIKTAPIADEVWVENFDEMEVMGRYYAPIAGGITNLEEVHREIKKPQKSRRR